MLAHFGTFCLQDLLVPPCASWVHWVPSGCLLGVEDNQGLGREDNPTLGREDNATVGREDN